MKILLLTTHLNIGGITSYVVSLAKALKAKEEEVFVVSGGGVMVPELTASNISHICLNINTKAELSLKSLKGMLEICRLVKRLDIDIIHSHTRVTQVMGFFVSKLCGIPFISTCHGFFNNNIGRKILPAWGDKVIAISEAVREHLEKDFSVPEDKVVLIYNGIDIKRFLRESTDEEKAELKERFGIKPGYAVIGTVARFTPDKGHDVILYAMVKILKEHKNIQAVFVGDGKEKNKILDLAQRLNLSENVVFIKPQINTAKVLSVMDIFIFTPRRKEGLGLAPLEALASGKPVIATNVGGIPSIVRDGVNGFLIEPSKPDLLVLPILRLLREKELYRKMAGAGRELVMQKFSIDGMAERTHDVYAEVINVK